MKSLEELKEIREKLEGQIALRTEDSSQVKAAVGMATCGIASGAREVLYALFDGVQTRNIDNVIVTQTGCAGLCQYEPTVEVTEPGKDKVTYIHMTPEKTAEVIEEHFIRGQVLDKYTLNSENR